MEFGVNLNNREPLITSDYTLADLLDLAEFAENRGFGSVWVGDSLFSKPRFEPISLLSAISQRTERAKLGTACLVTSTRNPLYLALEWATLDQLSGGRTVLGACMGNPEHGVRREFEALGLPFGRRAAVFEEGLAVLRSLWTTGKITHHGQYYDFDDVSFYSGTEMGPLMPVQQPPPTWVISNIRLTGELAPEVATTPSSASPFRRPRPVRPGGALRRRSDPRSAGERTRPMTEDRTEGQLRASAELVVDTCFEVKEGD